MKQFKINSNYQMISLCDQDCRWNYKVIARTNSTITLLDDRKKITKHRVNKKISRYYQSETIYPLGKYSIV